MDFGKGSDYVLAKVKVSGLPCKDEYDDSVGSVRVWLFADGRVEVMPDDFQND